VEEVLTISSEIYLMVALKWGYIQGFR